MIVQRFLEDIHKSVTAKLKAFPISDFARAMKWLEDRVNGVFECQETISNKYYLFEFFAVFSSFSQRYRKIYRTHLVILFLKNVLSTIKKWFAKSCPSVSFCDNRMTITTKFIVKNVIIQTCDHNKCENKKSNTSMKITHNSLQNDILKNWATFRQESIGYKHIQNTIAAVTASRVRTSNFA